MTANPAPQPLNLNDYFTMGSMELIPLQKNIPYEIYELYADFLGATINKMPFVVGDLLNYGENHYGESYADAGRFFGLKPETLSHYKTLATQFPPERRRPELSPTHHRYVAGPKLSQRVQDYLLDQAVEQDWSSSELRKRAITAKQMQAVEPDEEEDDLDLFKNIVDRVISGRGKELAHQSLNQLLGIDFADDSLYSVEISVFSTGKVNLLPTT